MCAGATGFSDGRKAEGETPTLAQLDHIDPLGVAQGADVAEAAAKAAVMRETRLASGPVPPPPQVTDLDAFRAKATARSKKYNAFVDKSKKLRENIERTPWL